MLNLKKINIVVIAATVLLLTSCHSSKQGVTNSVANNYLSIPENIADQTPQQRVYDMAMGYRSWTDLQTDLQISVQAPKSISLSAKAYMKRNEWVQISVRLLGFEVFQLWADNDSVHILDKYHKYYVSESVKSLVHNADITIGDLQDLMLGRAFILGSGTFTASAADMVDTDPTPQGLILMPRHQPNGFEYGFILSPYTNSLAATSMSIPDMAAATFAYANYATAATAGEFAGLCAINVQKATEVAPMVKAQVSWNPASSKWNSGQRRSWQRPSGYRRISSSQLLKALSNF